MGDANLAESLWGWLVLIEGERGLARRFEALFDFEGGRMGLGRVELPTSRLSAA